MGSMGVYRRILRSLKARTNQADNLFDAANVLFHTPNLSFKSQIEIVEAYTELSQRLNQTVSDNGHARTLQDHPSKTNDGGSDGGL